MIKIGEMYNVRVKVNGYNLAKTAVKAWDCSGLPCYFKLEDLSPISPSPKFDPCRKFRKGDVAELSRYKGRAIIPIDLKVGDKVKVCENEKTDSTIIHVKDPIGRRYFVNPAYLELVTPVEELEPYYYVAKNDGVHPTFLVRNRNEEHRVAAICECWNEEDAQRICDMYNAEYRKEQK